MKYFSLTVIGSGLVVLAFGMPSARALPGLFSSPVVPASSFEVLGSSAGNALFGSVLPPPAGFAAFVSTPPAMALNGFSFWGQSADSSLRLTNWRHVFDISALGAFDVPLRDDPAERTNILLAAQAVDNVTLAPGEEFSFNQWVGERTPERGYQDGLMFDQGRVVRGTGGGILPGRDRSL